MIDPFKAIAVERRYPQKAVIRLGIAIRQTKGWKFYPFESGRQKSRIYHRTLADCLPRWVGYPHECETREVST